MKELLVASVLLLSLAQSAQAQSVFTFPWQMTDSSEVVATPAHSGLGFATLALHHQARFRAGSETNFIVYQGAGWCEFACASVITQGITLLSNGVPLGSSGRAKAPFAQAGMCIPFDGVYDWGGASGWNSGYVYRPNQMSFTVPVSALGPTITVETVAQSTTDIVISCYATEIPYDLFGQLVWLNESYWSGDLTVSFSN